MATPKVIILSGYGINCEEETKFAFEKSGAKADIIHINDLIESPKQLKEYQIFVFPGGFSYGDDTGSGLALANKIKNNFSEELEDFINQDTLILGICNGFQVMVNLGLLPNLTKEKKIEIVLRPNQSFRYQCRWVNLKIDSESPSVFTKDLNYLYIPVAHGEGNFYADSQIIEQIKKNKQITMRYANLEGDLALGEFPFNPNGSVDDIASICDQTGRIMGMMPHPERGIFLSQRDDWPYLKEKMLREGQKIIDQNKGIKIFKNAVEYFK